MDKLRTGVIGAGTVSQVMHLPNLCGMPDRFDLVGVFDPSPRVRGFVQDRFGVPAFSEVDALLSAPLDAVVIASPDALHGEQVMAALAAGLHVFCEKPLAYGAGAIAEMIAARDAADKVLQVGYMKRFDPAYETLLDLLPADGGQLMQVVVEVLDPDSGPFIGHHPGCNGNDLPERVGDEMRRKRRAQLAQVFGGPLNDHVARGFCGPFASSIVHDVNAVHGLLDRLGLATEEVVGAQFYAEGQGGHGTVRLGGGGLWMMSHLTVPDLPRYCERISLVFESVSFELVFPSPWLANVPTGLTVHGGGGERLHSETIRCGYAEPFEEQLKGFHAAVVDGAPVRNTAEAAARDMALLKEMTLWQLTREAEDTRNGAVA
ncbi:Gfo/Idh/MocA family protein [Frigidibacter sp. ROC022]|uniref:Gfo/Idh/MocA family protein n=1 Tax=Frigidibacter sp. ROC022 TaxID=2971796 RepID=UPI00215B4258|nr:Gfo/Idh/MocA family oxidoreductase [Frigidibacter sp. ROC022]MCR8723531.1 Gfo/Idh/MocA family oxidoreductase [Frigidibacter sp. ROC022]